MLPPLFPSYGPITPFTYSMGERLIQDFDGLCYRWFPIEFSPIAYIVPDGSGLGPTVLRITGIAHGAIYHFVQMISGTGLVGTPMLVNVSERVKLIHDMVMGRSYIAHLIQFPVPVSYNPVLASPEVGPEAAEESDIDGHIEANAEPEAEPAIEKEDGSRAEAVEEEIAAPPPTVAERKKSVRYSKWTAEMKEDFKNLIDTYGRKNFQIYKEMNKLHPMAFRKDSRGKDFQVIYAKKALGFAVPRQNKYGNMEGEEFKIPRAFANQSSTFSEFVTLLDTKCPNWLEEHGFIRTPDRLKLFWKKLRSSTI